MSALKWSLLALTVLLSSEFCSAHRASVISDPDHDLTPTIPAMDLFAHDMSPIEVHASEPRPAEAHGSVPRPAVALDTPPGPISDNIPYPPPSPISDNIPYPPPSPIMAPPTPLMDGEEPSKAMTSGATESDISTTCSGGACGGWGGPPVCGGSGCGVVAPPCMQPPKNPYYCQPAGCAANPGFGCGSGGGFTIYLDDRFVDAVSNSGDGGKS